MESQLNQKEISRILALSDAFGPSGMEDEVTSLVRRELNEMGMNPEEDRMRNLRMELNPDAEGPKVMLDAHLDEVGVIVQAVKPDGTMTFLPLGGWAPASFPSSIFRLKNRDGGFTEAVVAAKPPHFMTASERDKAPAVENMVLDCGAVSREDLEQNWHLGIASFGVPSVKASWNAERQLFSGKAFDCRIGAAAEIETLHRLQKAELSCRVQAGFAVQEEVGERGVYANYKALQPDLMICFEGCPADDTFQEPWLVQAGLHRGPMLRHFDVSMITSPRFQRYALDLAHELNIPVQESVRRGGGTDGGRIHTEGVPAIVIGIPVRYIHSSHCYCTYEDYLHAVDLAEAICRRMDASILQSF